MSKLVYLTEQNESLSSFVFYESVYVEKYKDFCTWHFQKFLTRVVEFAVTCKDIG